MDNSPPQQSLYFCLRTYCRYILPTWLFPLYLLGWGFTVEHLKIAYPVALVLFFVTVGPPFFGTFLWSLRARKHMSYWAFTFLTTIVPFLIFVGTVLLLAVAQEILVGNGWMKPPAGHL